MTNPNPFDISTTDLGDSSSGVDKLGIDQAFSSTHLHTAPICLVCTNYAQYKMVPKHTRLANAHIEDHGFICQHCVSQQYISPDDYKLKQL